MVPGTKCQFLVCICCVWPDPNRPPGWRPKCLGHQKKPETKPAICHWGSIRWRMFGGEVASIQTSRWKVFRDDWSGEIEMRCMISPNLSQKFKEDLMQLIAILAVDLNLVDGTSVPIAPNVVPNLDLSFHTRHLLPKACDGQRQPQRETKIKATTTAIINNSSSRSGSAISKNHN